MGVVWDGEWEGCEIGSGVRKSESGREVEGCELGLVGGVWMSVRVRGCAMEGGGRGG